MGGYHWQYWGFALSHRNVVVMGFDMENCVHANLFGSNERVPNNPPYANIPESERAFVSPLTTLCNVVTARSVLVSSPGHEKIQSEYGELNSIS
jgi:hypothetical protein